MQDKKEKGRRNVRWLRHANSLNSLKGISPMNFPADVKYTKDHEWIRISGDTGIVGITDYAQGELGDVVFLELPAVGKMVKQHESFGTIEAVKAVSDLYAPVSGSVVEVNTRGRQQGPVRQGMVGEGEAVESRGSGIPPGRGGIQGPHRQVRGPMVTSSRLHTTQRVGTCR